MPFKRLQLIAYEIIFLISESTNPITEDARNGKTWLKVNVEPKEDVIKHWNFSFSLRSIKAGVTITQFFSEWPILETQLAPELVNLIILRFV